MKRIGLIVLVLALMGITSSWGEEKTIQAGSKVKFDYTLTVDGKVIESSEGKAPLEYTHGQGMIIPGLEKALEGLKVGQTTKVTVPPEEAYGPVNPQGVLDLPKSQLAPGAQAVQGSILTVQNKDGQSFNGTITEVKEESIVIDFNHPLAGKQLTFDVKVVSIE